MARSCTRGFFTRIDNQLFWASQVLPFAHKGSLGKVFQGVKKGLDNGKHQAYNISVMPQPRATAPVKATPQMGGPRHPVTTQELSAIMASESARNYDNSKPRHKDWRRM